MAENRADETAGEPSSFGDANAPSVARAFAPSALLLQFLDLDRIGPVGDPLARGAQPWLPSRPAPFDVRLVTTAKDRSQFDAAFPEFPSFVVPVRLPPLSSRPAEIGWLLSRLAAADGLTLPREALGERNEAALRCYAWPENMAEIRQAARGLAALVATHGAVKTAALRTGRKRETLRDWLRRVGIDPNVWKRRRP
jgi:hypothetical protein